MDEFALPLASPILTGNINVPHLPAADPTPKVLLDATSEHGLADLVFEPFRAAMNEEDDGDDNASALGLPAPVKLSPCDTMTIKAAYDVIARRVSPEFLLAERRAGKLFFFFPASDDDFSATVVRPVPRMLSDIIQRCSLMIKGDNPRLPRDALLSVGAGLPTLRMTSAEAASVSLHQPVLHPFLDLTPSVPPTVVVPRKHFTLLQQSAANASSAAAFIRLLSLAITEVVSTSPFLADDAEDLHLLQSVLAFLSRDLAVVVSTAEVNLRLLDRDVYLAASTLPRR